MGQILKISVVVLFFLFLGFSVGASNHLDVVINEIAWMGTIVSYNDEWIELKNNTGQEISLDGWLLKAADGTPEIKLARTVLNNGFYLLERTDDNTVPGITADQIYTGALSNGGEVLELYDNFGNLIDKVDASASWSAGDNETKQTMERTATYWQTSAAPGGTPMAENSSLPKTGEAGSSLILTETEPPKREITGVQPRQIYPSGIIINEILPSPFGPDEEGEWIEIFNKNNFEVNISGWQIIDKEGSVNIYVFPEGSAIEPNSFLVLSRPTTKITLNNQGDRLQIIWPDGNIIDEVNYEDAPRSESYSLFESGWTWTSAPTPGAINTLPTPAAAPNEPPQTLAAIGESLDLARDKQPLKTSNSNSLFIYLAAIFTSFFGGVIILILKHVRA